jgi:hypothetical protein
MLKSIRPGLLIAKCSKANIIYKFTCLTMQAYSNSYMISFKHVNEWKNSCLLKDYSLRHEESIHLESDSFDYSK